ncbi:MAG: Fic family protein [Candidatus Magasanikbacteria bacterium]|nr:Fic family protein [Candidatus Magasanikbacteria bacterium]
MLNKRQKAILELVEQTSPVSAKQILDGISDEFEKVSKPTVLRDLEILLANQLIKKRGRARSVVYESKGGSKLLKYFDVQKYFDTPVDERTVKKQFVFDIFNNTPGLFTAAELKHLKKLNEHYQAKIKKLVPAALKREIERITIELSWKSSQLEGNTYSLIDTEVLIKESREAAGHPKEEATMILNHKRALDYIFSNPEEFKKITIAKIRAIHSLLTKNLGIPDNFRKISVGIIGTNYQPLSNQFQIKEALEKTVEVLNSEPATPAKALIAATFIAYIQPFVDGNKRTSRITADALLLAHGWCPLSLRSMDAAEYKKALILFYEQNSLRYFKELFMEQFEFAVQNYFG